jgi:hypothetical protein
MSMYGSPSSKVEFDVTVGGALQDVSAQVTSISDIAKKAGMTDITGFSTGFPAHTFTAFSEYDDVTMTGPYDDAATTGSAAVFDKVGETRTLKVTYGGTKTTTGETIIISFKKKVVAKLQTLFEVVVRFTGTVTEA